ncbi:MAG: DUF1501 domain-containing protein [Planctomycetaceae bacterium]|nr:DUF1501 domain-containing protein [Planctomycetaceae bacterium]
MATLDRRELLRNAACGFGSLALAGLCADDAGAAARRSLPLFAPRAKRIIFVFMQGGPSHVDSFDYKPELIAHDGEQRAFRDARKLAKTGMSGEETLMRPLWPYRQYGETGRWVSDLFPQIGRHADELCFLHGMHTNGVAHGPATLFLHTGATNLIRPSIGSWVSYGLGSENRNLPAFVTLCPSSGNGGPRNFSNAFLPAEYQGTAISRAGQPATEARPAHIVNRELSSAEQRRQLDLLQAFNRDQQQRTGAGASTDLDAVVESYELAWRMQMHAPGLFDLSQETAATLQMYGIGEGTTDDFGRQCLLARRMAEAGVRFIQVSYADNTDNPRWDQHSNMPKHAEHALATDKPVAGLLADLKQRGLLEDTLLWWGGEFGRNPFTQGNNGRDHNPKGFTQFLAGGGVKAGFAHGATDEFGHEAIAGRVHMHDLHATLLHLLGLDHERLTYRYAGRDFRLTDIAGRVVEEILT